MHGIIRVFDIQKEENYEQKEHVKRVWYLKFLNNKKFANCSEDRTIKICDLEKREVIKTLKGHEKPVIGLEIVDLE